MEFLLFVWVMIAIVCAVVASNKGRSGFGWLILGAVFGVFALIVIACLSSVGDEDALKRCPDCAEAVQPQARVCKHCGYRFEGRVAA
jgi:hypothetical protein